MTVTIGGQNLEVLNVVGSQRNFQGANRSTLEFHFAKEATTFAELDTLFKNPPDSLTLTDDSGAYAHDNYTLRVSLALSDVVVTPGTDTTPAVTEEHYIVIMAQKTYAEKQQEAIKAQSDMTLNAFIDFCTNALPNIMGIGE
ncbi:hypothetical protein SAMN02745823_03815 [Sporobacter termitidis DSM 10068]|uniref:Uncharacterized protein n=1 Tax=Sporobacter termitidis DSM 10068 TaxID=1123282 RepID=A0A1M5ZJU0_9FIRM|nr:hypothetical protein [Sporobacter termitidis]SHI24213.1 hypothetical protein SAMN02745823_03815 [Sporobacter termitidis DSM 10068]